MAHVLVPIDGSEPSWAALDLAAETVADGKITVMHVIDPLATMHGGDEDGYYNPAAYEMARERGERLLEEAESELASTGVLDHTEFESVIKAGRPARTIVDYIDEEDIDHVIIGSHGRSGVSRIVLGSVAETVARRAAIPVTIVR